MNHTTDIPNVAQVAERANRGKLTSERFQFRHVHAITGTFVLIVVGVLVAALIMAGRSQRWFIGNVTLRVVLPEAGAAGIRQGSEVYFLGTLMGTVADVTVNPAGRMEAEVNIRRDFFLFVRADSSAVVKRKFGVVGDAYFEITRGQGQPLPEKNASIVCNEQLPSPLESAVDEVRREGVPALKKLSAGLETWTVLGSNLVASQARLDQLLERADSIAANLQNGKGSVGQLLTDPETADELLSLLQNANRSMNELQNTLTNLQQASGNLQLASTNLPAISEALGKEAEGLPGLVMQSQTSMRELQRLIDAMQRHWLFRKYVNKTNPPPLRPLPPSEAPPKNAARSFRSPRDLTR
jgi:phospholipid/cholesterol/gamma-HCH transport system substrate-binding protein